MENHINFTPPTLALGILESTDQQGNQENQNNGDNIGQVAHEEAGLVQPLHKDSNLGIGRLRRLVNRGLFVQGIGRLVELIHLLGATRASATDRVLIVFVTVVGRARHHALGLEQQQIVLESSGLLSSRGRGAQGRFIVGDIVAGVNFEIARLATGFGFGHVGTIVGGGGNVVVSVLVLGL